jgi:hypothetical protein
VNWKPEGSGLVLKKTAIAATVAARSCAMSILDLINWQEKNTP